MRTTTPWIALIVAAGCGRAPPEAAAVDAGVSIVDAAGESSIDAAGELGVVDVAQFDAAAPGPWLREIGAAAGVSFTRTAADFDPFVGRMSGGLCAFDLQGDGLPELFMPQTNGGSHLFVAHAPASWVDEGVALGVADVDAGGCLATDLDGDGALDLVTLGATVRTFRFDGARFVETPARLAGVGFASTTLFTSAVAFDADGDGDLDLAIAAYGRYVAPADPSTCVIRCDVYNGYYAGGTTALLLQRPDGTFADDTDAIRYANEQTLVLLATDLDEDGAIDLFVGVDSPSYADRYYRNDGRGHFTEVAHALGVAFDARKSGVSSMSVEDGDVDGDGRLDLVESSWDDDPDPVFRCTGIGADARCDDIGESLGLFRTPRNLRWGQALVDLDDDGVLELFEAMSHVYTDADVVHPFDGGPLTFGPLADTPLLWRRTTSAAPLDRIERDSLGDRTAGRGVVAVDVDRDGDLDAVVASALGRPLVYENVRATRGHALTVVLQGRGKNPRAVGAKVEVRVGARLLPSLIHAGLGYRSSVDAPLHVGIGAAERADSIDVRWPSGSTSHLDAVRADTTVTIAEP